MGVLTSAWVATYLFIRSGNGQDLMEYGLLMALIAIVAYGAVASVGTAINTTFWQTIANNF